VMLILEAREALKSLHEETEFLNRLVKANTEIR